jgi:hypothetical protein
MPSTSLRRPTPAAKPSDPLTDILQCAATQAEDQAVREWAARLLEGECCCSRPNSPESIGNMT